MLSKFIVRIRQFIVLSFALLLGAVSASSHAAVFRTRFDPQFSVAFSALVGVNVGWSGSAQITVDNACLATSSTVNFPNDCGATALDGFTLIFYNINTNATISGVSGAGPGLPDPTAVHFDGAGVADGMNLTGLLLPGAYDDGTNVLDADLSFSIDSGPMLALSRLVCSEGCFLESFEADIANFPPRVVWTRVPEPASLALVGVALAMLGVARRRNA